jgi:hypothetical protein
MDDKLQKRIDYFIYIFEHYGMDDLLHNFTSHSFAFLNKHESKQEGEFFVKCLKCSCVLNLTENSCLEHYRDKTEWGFNWQIDCNEHIIKDIIE